MTAVRRPPHFVGGFAEYCYVMPGTCVIKIPDELPDEVAASANCALATFVAGWDAARLQPGDNVLIQGPGHWGSMPLRWPSPSAATKSL